MQKEIFMYALECVRSFWFLGNIKELMLYLVNPSKNFIWDKTKRFKAFYKIQFTTHLISLESSHTVTVASYIGYTRLAVVKGS